MVVRLCLMLFPAFVWAQVEFSLSARQLAQNDVLVFSVTINNPTSDQELEWPKGLNGGEFEWIRNSTSSQTSMSIVNGRASHVQTLNYQFRPKSQGKFVFPAQVASYGGKEFRSEAVEITVSEPNTRIQSRAGSSPNGADPFDSFFNQRRRDAGQPEMFVRSEVPKKTYFVGEAITFITRIYLRGVRVYSDGSRMDMPAFEGFWVEELDRTAIESESVVIDNKSYDTAVVDARLVYANKPGTIIIPPAKFNLNVSTGSFMSRAQSIYRETEPVELIIKPHPANAPKGFSGVVGKFDLQAVLDRDQVKVGESVSLKITVSGQGNFSAINDFPIKGLDPSFEFFAGGSPQVGHREGRAASKTWTHAFVPKSEGSYEIPEVSFSFLDPNQGSYSTLKQGPFVINVSPGDGTALTGGPLAQSQLKMSDQSMHFIKLKGGTSDHRLDPPNPIRIIQVAMVFVLLNVILLAFFAVRGRSAQRRVELRPKYAYRSFKTELSRLRAQSDKLESDIFFTRLSAALFSYFGDKWERPANGISLETIHDVFRLKNIDDPLYRQVVDLVEACDFARFTPSSSSSKEQLLERARQTIKLADEALP